MYYYKTQIQYNGTNYAGFQWQNDLKTIQSDINKSLGRILIGKYSTTAASRTDTGVHAVDQTVKITCENPIDEMSFLQLFNAELPSQIKCITVRSCDGSFRPSSEVVSKEYRYFFTNEKQIKKEDHLFVANISNELNLQNMQKCIDALIGEHNFCNFYSSGSNVKSTVRTIMSCELTLINPQDLFSKGDLFKIPSSIDNCYQLKITAKGFLKQMIRHIVSALWMVGSGKISVDEFKNILSGQKSLKQLWKVAPANGLFLYKITY